MNPKTHLTEENREVIEDGIRNGNGARHIGRRIGFSGSTVTREVKANRTVKRPKSSKRHPAFACARHRDCDRVGYACEGCGTAYTACKKCRNRDCTATCPDFELAMCPTTQKWPYVCPDGCRKRAHCGFPKCSYRKEEAQRSYKRRLSESREGINMTEGDFNDLDATVSKLVRQGHSFEAISLAHDLPVCTRTLYVYQEKGLFSVAHAHLPRKVRVKPRRKRGSGDPGRSRIDRTGRTYADFEALSEEDRDRVIQGDSVCGFEWNEHDCLSLHNVKAGFQLYLHKRHADAAAVVGWYDHIERLLGSPAAFERYLGIQLLDRGCEFDDWEGMERSCLVPGAGRCRVFYCDPMESNQKSQAERNHEQLRRVLVKGRTDFDRLSQHDMAECCSHVNSYPLERLKGKCPFECVEGWLPAEALAELGIVRIPTDEVVLRPSLMAHAVLQ